MEDLFGHRIRPIMPKTKAVEDHIYNPQPSDRDDYRGIKDTDFSLECFSVGLEEQGYLKSGIRPLNVMGDGVPKIDPYTYESIGNSCRRVRLSGQDEIQELIELTGEQFAAISCRIPEEYQNITYDAFKLLSVAVSSVATLSDRVMAETLEAIAEVCSTEFDAAVAVKNLLDINETLESVCDAVLVDGRNQGTGCYPIGSRSNEAQLQMVQEDFEASMQLFKETLARIGDIEKDILNITCHTQNIIAHCMRIEGSYDQFTIEGRPTRGKLARFARDIEKVLVVLDTFLYTLLYTCEFTNAIYGIKNRMA